MLHPKKVMSQHDGSCQDSVYGDHWLGPARLSLIDHRSKAAINTIEIRGHHWVDRVPQDEFAIPFHLEMSCLARMYYRAPGWGTGGRGAPRIMTLRDLTGEGIAGQFVLHEYINCGSSFTSVLGYSESADRAVQYSVASSDGVGAPQVMTWVPYSFGVAPLRPGYWKFTHEPGYGADSWIDQEIIFNKPSQVFVRRVKVRPYPKERAIGK